jgi:hypothetical protein
MQQTIGNRMGRKLAGILFLTTALLWATNKGPDAGSYTATDNAVYSFIDPAGSGSASSILSGTDDGGAALTLPTGFNFSFYGQSYTMLCVSPNGLVYLMANQSVSNAFCGTPGQLQQDAFNLDLSSNTLANDAPLIAPFWTDLTFAPNGAGAVYYQTIGSTPGSRQFVIEWSNAFPVNSQTPVTFEIVPFEGSNNILFQYQNVTGAGNGTAATVGIHNTAGLAANQQIQWSFDSGVIADSSAIAFNLPTGGASSVNVVTTSPPGVAITVDNVVTQTPATADWIPQSSHTLVAPPAQTTGGFKLAFSQWAYGNSTSTNTTLTDTARNTGITYTATYNTQYLLTLNASPSNEGSVSGPPGGPFYDANSMIAITATPAQGYVFKGFTGDLTATANPGTLTMDGGPKTVTATFGISNSCAVLGNQTVTLADVQAIVNQALGKQAATADVNADGSISVIDIQFVLNAVLYSHCAL